MLIRQMSVSELKSWAKIIVNSVGAFKFVRVCSKINPKLLCPPPYPYPMLNMKTVIYVLSKDILLLTTLKGGSRGR